MESIEYDTSSDEITVEVKYSIMKVSIVLTKAARVPTIAELYQQLLSDPEGTYAGSKTILGEEIDGTVVFNSASSLQMVIGGVVSPKHCCGPTRLS